MVDFQKIIIPGAMVSVPMILATFWPMPLPVLYGVMATFFIGIVLLFNNLPQKYKQVVTYTPLIFILIAITKIQKKVPRIGMILLLVALFLLGIYFINELFVTDKSKKLFITKTDKIIFLAQISMLLILSIFILQSVVSIRNMYANAIAKSQQ